MESQAQRAPAVSVLLVDPFRDEVEMYAEFLRATGFRAEVCTDADRAHTAVVELDSDVVVARLRQSSPTMDGLELVRRLKTDERTQHVGVVIISASIYTADREACIAAGCRYLMIPCVPEELAAEIRIIAPERRLGLAHSHTRQLRTAKAALRSRKKKAGKTRTGR